MAVAAALYANAAVAGAAIYAATTVLTYVAIAVVTSLVLRALMPTPAMPSFGGGNKRNRGYNITQTGSAMDHQIIYGKMKVAPVRIFDQTTGTDNVELHRVIAFAGHEIESFDEIYINDDLATLDSGGNVTSPSHLSGKVIIKKHLGASDQAADSTLVSAVTDWTAEHRLRGVAYMYVKFTYDADAFPSGVPEITSVIKGKKVFDPRDSSTAWSDSPALCLRDYLTNDGYGLGEIAASVDDVVIAATANVCAQTNTTAGTTRYTLNGAFTTSSTPVDFLQNAITSMGGTLWYNQGKWRMKAAAYVAASVNFDENDLRSGISLATRNSRRDNFNIVNGTFRGSESNWQVTDFPPVTNSAFVTADGGQESPLDLDLTFTDNSIEARRIARITLERNRQQLTVEASFGLRAFQVQTGDNITLTNARLGWSSKEFEVMNWSFASVDEYDLQIKMTLREISSSVFDEVSDGVVYERDNTTLPSAFTVPAVGLSLSTDLRRVRGKTLGVLQIDVSNSSNIMDTAEVQYRKTGDTNYTSLGFLGAFTGTERVEVIGIENGRYDIRARAVNSLGVKGVFNTTSNFNVDPLSAPPADVTNFTGNIVGSNLFLTWTPVPDLDLAHYIVKYSSAVTDATYGSAVTLADVPASSSSLPVADAGAGTYFIKAVDDSSSGSNTSVNPAQFVVTSVSIEPFNVVATIREDPSFSGVKDKIVLRDGSIQLDFSPFWDEATGQFDARAGNLDDFYAFQSSGIYYFSNHLDLGDKFTSRMNLSFTSARLDATQLFDASGELFDATAGFFDDSGTFSDDTSVGIQLRHTNDDPSGTPTYTDWQDFSVTDITARAFQFRALLSSTNPNATPRISKLAVNVDMPDRVAAGSDIAVTGTKVITYANGAFAITPAIGLSLADLAIGDRYTITNKTRTGFTINTFTGSAVSTNTVNMDYVAKGYGKELT